MRTVTAANFSRYWDTISEAEQSYWLNKLSRGGDYVSFLARHGFRAPARTLVKVRQLIQCARSEAQAIQSFERGDW